MSVTTNFMLDYPKSIDNCDQSLYNSLYPNDIQYVKNDEKNLILINDDNQNPSPPKWNFIMQLYFGSITVVGLYILFKLIQKSK